MRKTVLLSVAAMALIASPVASQSIFSQPSAVGNNSVLSIDNERGVLTMAPLLDRISPAVVSIRTEAGTEESDDELTEQEELFERFFGRQLPRGGQRRGGSTGSGVIVDAGKGYILTNNHVVEDADEIIVTLKDKRELTAELIGGDDKTDIAVLKVKASGLKEVNLARDDSTRVGDYVIAIGNPFGLNHTVTSGIVSALGRELSRGDRYQDFIQTDASINPGNSGGALVNSKGELIGINTAIVSRSGGNNGIGFAVPAKMARGVMNQLVSYGEVKRGRIGVTIRDITPDFKEAFELSTLEGAFINDVIGDGAADKAGLQSGDIVVEFNGDDILDSSDLRNAVGLVQPGTRTDLTYLRDGARRNTKITIEAVEKEREVLDDTASEDVPAMESFSGASITDIPDDVELRGGDKGAYVASVRGGSKASRAGLASGDVIRKVGRTTINNLKDFEDAISEKDGPIALTVERDGTTLFLAVK